MTLTLDIPNDVEAEKRVRLAVALYDARAASLDAAEIAGLSPAAFQEALDQAGVSPVTNIPAVTPEMAEELAALKTRHVPQSLDELTPRVPTPPGMTAIGMMQGQWPGDETEEELLALLAADRAKDRDRARNKGRR
jgi:hypothetical protein